MGCDTGREEEACIAKTSPREEEGAGCRVRHRSGGDPYRQGWPREEGPCLSECHAAIPREEERARRDNGSSRGGRALPNFAVAPPGRRREAPPEPRPREEEGSGILILLAPGRFAGDAGDHAAMQAQIIQFAVRQVGQFGHGLAIHGTTGACFLQAHDQSHDAVADCALFTGGLGQCVRCGHFSIASVSGSFGSVRVIRSVERKMPRMLRLHN